MRGKVRYSEIVMQIAGKANKLDLLVFLKRSKYLTPLRVSWFSSL
jgi:hypothetical protein